MKSRNRSSFARPFSPRLEELLNYGYSYSKLSKEDARLIHNWEKSKFEYHQSIIEARHDCLYGKIISELKL